MVKNLIVNREGFLSGKKFKFSKISIGVVALITSISMFLTGCGNLKKDDDYYYIPSTDVNYMDSYDAFNDPLVKIDYNDYSNSDLEVTNEAYNQFVNYIDELKTIYNYESYYDVDTALMKYNQIKDQKTKSHAYSIEKLTVDALIKKVKSNNADYLEIKKQEYVSAFYEEFSEEELKKICQIIIDTVNYYNNKGLVEDINEVKCILGNLKIFKRTTMTNAYISDDNCLMISPSMIKTLEIKVIGSKQDVYKSTIAHEVMHMLQKCCEDNNKIAYSIGNSYKFDDMKVHPLFYNWFYEGSAEKLMTNQYSYQPVVYEYYINYINSLGLATVLNENNYVNQPEETTLKNSLEPLFNMFGCKDEEDKKEVVKLMYSLDIIETDTEDFVNAVNPEMTEEQLVNIKRDLKGSICETLSKYFYKNLAELVKNNKIPLEDVFYFITIFEADVDSHIVFGDEEKYNASVNFVENYLDIQKNFFNFLASSNNYSQEEIEKMFDSYGIKRADGNENFDLSYLNKEKKQFLKNMLNKVYDNSMEQIVDFYNKNTVSNLKK